MVDSTTPTTAVTMTDGAAGPDVQIVEAFRELERGEKTAHALEAHLTALERKIDDLLASVEDGRDQGTMTATTATTTTKTMSSERRGVDGEREVREKEKEKGKKKKNDTQQ